MKRRGGTCGAQPTAATPKYIVRARRASSICRGIHGGTAMSGSTPRPDGSTAGKRLASGSVESTDAAGEIRDLRREAVRRLQPPASHAANRGLSEREGMISSESRMREIRTSGLMSGGLETGPRRDGLRPGAKETEQPPYPTVTASAPDSTDRALATRPPLVEMADWRRRRGVRSSGVIQSEHDRCPMIRVMTSVLANGDRSLSTRLRSSF